MFITLEGGEGAGKSTQIKMLADSLRAAGHDVVTTREPGGTPEAEKIRALLVNRDGGAWTPTVECLLLYAARAQHVETLIKPALAAGKIVISDRFADSTRAYQAYGHGLSLGWVESLNDIVLGDFKPDLTFIMDLDVEIGLTRAGRRLQSQSSTEDKFESLGLDFHNRLRNGFLDIAARDPERCVVVDATRTPDAIAADLCDIVLRRLVS
jgi:dTMP kinase